MNETSFLGFNKEPNKKAGKRDAWHSRHLECSILF
jgi:hypothetical protein